MLLHDARRAARSGRWSDLVLLEDQDRSRWDRTPDRRRTQATSIAPGAIEPDRSVCALRLRSPSPRRSAPRYDETDSHRIVSLYGALASIEPLPVVELNRAAAEAIAFGPARGLARMDGLLEALAEYPYLHASRAELSRRLGRLAEAVEAYRLAIRFSANASERRFLEKRLAEIGPN